LILLQGSAIPVRQEACQRSSARARAKVEDVVIGYSEVLDEPLNQPPRLLAGVEYSAFATLAVAQDFLLAHLELEKVRNRISALQVEKRAALVRWISGSCLVHEPGDDNELQVIIEVSTSNSWAEVEVRKGYGEYITWEVESLEMMVIFFK
jgi:hypothetical protein